MESVNKTESCNRDILLPKSKPVVFDSSYTGLLTSFPGRLGNGRQHLILKDSGFWGFCYNRSLCSGTGYQVSALVPHTASLFHHACFSLLGHSRFQQLLSPSQAGQYPVGMVLLQPSAVAKMLPQGRQKQCLPLLLRSQWQTEVQF